MTDPRTQPDPPSQPEPHKQPDPSSQPGREPSQPGPKPGARERLTGASDRAQGWLESAKERKPSVNLAAAVLERFQQINGSFLGGYLAYRMFLLFVPMIAIVVALAGFSTSTSQDTSEHLRLGAAVASSIAQAGSDAHNSRLPLLVTGLVGFVIAAWGFLGGLQFAAAQAWGIPTKKFPHKSRAFVRFAGSMLLFGAVFYVSALVRRAGAFAGLAGSLTTLLSASIAYFGLAWILPHRCKEWFWLLPGTAAAATLHVGLQAFATFYLPDKLAGASQTYGAMGIALTMFTYLLLLGLIMTVTPTVNAVVWERYQQDPPGLLRRIAEKVPIPTTSAGSGYVPEGGTVETSVNPGGHGGGTT